MKVLLRLFLRGVVACACLATVGCAQSPRAVVLFEEPRVFVHMHADPQEVEIATHGDRMSVHAKADAIVVSGLGTAVLEGYPVEVQTHSLVLNGVTVESRGEGYRNVVLTQSGSIEIDRFISWE